MQLTSGHCSLSHFHDFVVSNPSYVARIYKNTRTFKEIISQTVKDIPADRGGWYLWGRINDANTWETVYVGKAGHAKTACIQDRLKKELFAERAMFWAAVNGVESALQAYKEAKYKKYDPDRQIRKQASRHVIWIAASISNKEIGEEEKALIKLFNPTANVQRSTVIEYTEKTETIVAAINSVINTVVLAHTPT